MTLPTAIILAGGFGSRLRSVVPNLPKPLAPIHGMPFLHYLLEDLKSQGVRRTVISTGYLAEIIEARLGHQHGPMEILYSREDAPLGTGGALKLAIDRFGLNKEVLALNGDTYFPAPLEHMLSVLRKTPSAHFAIALKRLPYADRYGTVELAKNGTIGCFVEKGLKRDGLINGGIYALRTKVFDAIAPGEFFSLETTLLVPLAETGSLVGLPFDAPFIDIGMPEDYARASQVVPTPTRISN